MAEKIRYKCVWSVLMKYAHDEGQARMEHLKYNTPYTREKLQEAIKVHEDYKNLCLEADGMIGLEGVFT